MQAREATDENAPRSKKQKLNFSEIKCICLNVCGIKSKLVLPAFIQLITLHDICIFIETKTDKYDILNIPDGFSYFEKNRKIFKHTSGGIVVVYRNNLKNHIKFKYLIMTFYWDVHTPYLKTLYIRQ
jgi:hypothetical protein